MDRYAAMPPLEALPKAKAAARKALEIDDRLAEAHTSLAWARALNWEWKGAEEDFRRAIALNPEYAHSHRFYGFMLASLGRFDEAISEYERALEIDPLSLIINGDYGWAFYCARRYDEAIDQLLRTVEMDPAFPQTYLWLGLAYMGAGKLTESAEAFEEGARLTNGSPTMLAGLAQARSQSGIRADAERILADMKERAKTGYVPMVAMVQLHLALGDIDGTFEWLEKAFDYRASFLVPMKVYPFLDPIRDDPRFREMLRGAGHLS